MPELTLLEEFIEHLKAINYAKGFEAHGKYKELGEFIDLLSAMDKNVTPDVLASAFVLAFCRFPDLFEKSETLRAFGQKIPCKTVYFTRYTYTLFSGDDVADREEPSARP